MKGSMHNMSKHRNSSPTFTPDEVEETMKLYHAWLGYLLTRLESDTLRVKASDITSALDKFTCTVTREGDEYVICLDRREGK